MSAQSPAVASPKRMRLGTPSVLRNIFSNWGSYALATLVSFFISPYIVRKLGVTGYGVWTLILSLTGYLGLLDLGVRGAVTRYVAKFYAQAKHERSSHVASSAMVIFATAGMVAVLASAILAGFVVGHLRIPVQYQGAARLVLILIGLNIAASLINGVYGGILVGLQRFDLTNSIDVALNLVRAGATVYVLHEGFGIITLACLQLGFTLARWTASAALVRRLYPELRIRVSLADRPGLKLIFSFSVFSFLLQLSGSLIYATDNVVIGAYLGVAAVTFFSIAGNLADYTRAIVGGISQTMTPLASSTEATSSQEQVQKIVLFGGRIGSMAVLPIAVTFMLRGASFIGLWMGPEYVEQSGKVLWILSWTLLFWAANSVTAGSLLGMSKHRPLVPALMAEGVLNLALSIFLVKRMGIYGVAWGTVIPSLCSSFLFWPWYVRQTLGIRPLTYAMSVWVRPVLAVLPFALATYAMERYFPATRMMVFFLEIAAVLPLAAAGYWVLCLSKTQREDYVRGFSQSLTRVFARS